MRWGMFMNYSTTTVDMLFRVQLMIIYNNNNDNKAVSHDYLGLTL